MKPLAIATILLILSSLALGQEWDAPTEETQKLTASDGQEGDTFGHSVSLSGDVALVGAPATYVDDDFDDSGSVYVFRYDPDDEEWVEEQKLTASRGTRSSWLGSC